MSTQTTKSEYLVLSRGTSSDEILSSAAIEKVSAQFYAWLERLISEGKSRSGSGLAPESKIVAGRNAVTDGPFAESKEAIAGYWFILANSLEEAVEIAKGNPCLEHGATVEVRRILPGGECLKQRSRKPV